MFLHQSSASDQRACLVSLWGLCSGDAEAAGERMACFLLSERTHGLGHGSVEWDLEAFMPLGKEHTQCMSYVVSRLSSQ